MTLRQLLTSLLLLALAASSAVQPRSSWQPPAAPTAAGSPDLSPYRGPGMWVDVYDRAALSDPEGAAATMAAHGIRTLYLETGSWKRPFAVVHPAQDAALIEAAHAHGMKVVTWYLPKFEDVDTDLRRIMRSIEFETPHGQRADSFALDIEAPEVEPVTRIQNLLTLSAMLRARVGPDYAVGAIIPSPRGMIRVPDYWPGFPYERIPDFYDVILPMSYYTFHYDGAKAAHTYITDNIRIIRRETGRADVPIHPIGGLTADTSGSEAEAVVRAAREQGVMGVSLYEYGDMTAVQWAALERMPVQPGVTTTSPARLPATAAVGFLPKRDHRHPKEAFFAAPASSVPLLLRFQVFDAQVHEVAVYVNWRFAWFAWPSRKGRWSDTRRRTIPARMLMPGKVNLISFLAEGNFPEWSTWGVRSVSAQPAS
jgi:hypothetical protein